MVGGIITQNDRPDKYSFNERYKKAVEFHFCYDKEVLNDILKVRDFGKVLDLGCGVSGMSLILAEKGFNVTAIDISEIAIEKLKDEAKKRKLDVNFVLSDLEDYKIEDEFDVILCQGILQFFGRDGKDKIKDIQGHTSKGGINLIDTFLNRNTTYYDFMELYSDWEILEEDVYEAKTLRGEKKKRIYMIGKK